jgi:large subunit ribosomal protein L24
MNKIFPIKTKKSSKPNKQRKMVYDMPLHRKGKLLNVHLSLDLRKKYFVRNLRVRKGDKVKIVSGQHKGKTGKVDEVHLKYSKVIVNGIFTIKKDGSKSFYRFDPSNLMIIELDSSDNKRLKKLKEKISKVKDNIPSKSKVQDKSNLNKNPSTNLLKKETDIKNPKDNKNNQNNQENKNIKESKKENIIKKKDNVEAKK